ncbi:hypothetical protein [Stratiformator vulcanicus]|uniref:Glycosyltransferase RgtA/B/C/D-like domain-containing protein n=1 Tax=Stratiformator vulcanicus TaxID=2527980 RepID=A0A517R0Q6_9PLAN|nr:hypothetical protein [Stratiformator vulcanicus]QDT37458.1 hypothetical protein Pan189_18380 [Stratiformator vulcanicus]
MRPSSGSLNGMTDIPGASESAHSDGSPASAPTGGEIRFGYYYLIVIVVAAGLHAAAIWNAEPLQSANDRSRWATVWSLVERNSFQIDRLQRDSGWRTIDRVLVDGHFYSSKPPLLPLVTAGIYAGYRQALDRTLTQSPTLLTRHVLTILNLLPLVAALWLTCRIVDRYARSSTARLIVPAVLAFGTFLSPFSVVLNNHTPAAMTLVFSIYALLSIYSDGRRSAVYFAAVGFFAAATVANELPALAWCAICFAAMASKDWKRTLLYAAPAAAVVAITYFVSLRIQTGGWKPFYAYYGTELYRYVHEGVPSYWLNPQGIDRNLDSPPMYLFHCILGHHGIISLTPIFAITFFGWFRLWQDRRHPLMPLSAVTAALTVVVLGFYLMRTENYNYGGNSSALRWALWMIPLWTISLIPALDAWGEDRRTRLIAALLLGASVASAWSSVDNPWRHSWLYREMESAGLIDYSTPLEPLPRTITTWFPSLPGAADQSDESKPWVTFASVNEDGSSVQIRLTSLGIENRDERVIQKLKVNSAGSGSNLPDRMEFAVDRELFEGGSAPEEFLITPTEQPERERVLKFLQMVPGSYELLPGTNRYLRTDLRQDAFRCRFAAATISKTNGDNRNEHRIETYLCEEIPFGCLKFRIITRDGSSGTTISRKEFVVTGSNPPPPPISPLTPESFD